MTHKQFLSKAGALIIGAALLTTSALFADIIETKDGSRLNGKVSQVDAGVVVISTDFAGDIKIKRSEIVAITTNAPINLRLDDGRVVNGTIATAGADGAIAINSNGTSVATTNLGQVKQSWAPDAKDPELVARERHWSYEAGMDVTGKTGNSEQIGTSFSFRATLKSSFDTLQLYAGYDRQVTDKQKSTDLFRIGADYSNNFSGRYSWYARDEAGFDRVKDIDLYNTAAAGLGYDLIKNKLDTLTFRAGVSHRYEKYGANDSDNLSEMGLDLALINQLVMKTWSMTNRITYTPAFSDFGNYRIYHESYIELPMASPRWKFRVGVSNDYTSETAADVERLDTTYFARLILSWK